MIVLEIDEEKGISHWEVLGLSPSALDGKDENEQKQIISEASTKARKKHRKMTNRGDKAAEVAEARIGEATTILKDSAARKKYMEELREGRSGLPDVLRVGHAAPAFFWDRMARFRTIEQQLRQMRSSGNFADEARAGAEAGAKRE